MGTRTLTIAAVLAFFACVGERAQAQSVPMPDEGKLLATSGAVEVEGAGGGGLTPWALITGYGTRASYGANAHYTFVGTQDYAIHNGGVAVGMFDRLELSFNRQEIRGTAHVLDGVTIRQDIFGLKVKVLGDAVYDQDKWLPQLAVGAMFKHNKGIGGLAGLGVYSPTDLGAKKNDGTDFYLSATKIFLAQSFLLNATLRFTKANQFGLLGFGGDRNDNYRPEFETSVAYLLSKGFAVGAEFRSKPHNLSIDDEKNVWDAFAAWFPSKHVSVVAAYLDLSTIVTGTGSGPGVPGTINTTKQRGPYVSLAVGF
jgi:Protein of unknown function (DUF3034)